jgi:ribonucleoside-diphosphate reductase alpha chain
MIETLIKRDGTTEPFTPSKVNNWGKWSSKDLNGLVDWSMIVLGAIRRLGKSCTSQDLQMALVTECVEQNTSSYNKMGGKLYSVWLSKHIHGSVVPTIKELHGKIIPTGLMRPLDYSDEDYAYLETVIDHERDFDSAYFELHQVREKYSIQNRITGQEYETQQFVYMRMAMALSEDQPADRRLYDCESWYNHFSFKQINAPTPNFVNLGTPHRGFASCCLYTTKDSAISLAIGDHIAYIMTCMSAGIGGFINTRSLGDPVRSGAFQHQGKLPYYRALLGANKANLQNGRGGACTTYFSAFDPEAVVINMLQNPKSTVDKRIRGIDYNCMSNKLFARKAAKNEQVFTFNTYTAPDLFQAFFSADQDLFQQLYDKYEADDSFKKNYISARDLILQALIQAEETGRQYLAWADEMNRHTPFKDPIYSSNLCAEIMEPTKGYEDMKDLYSDHEVGVTEFGFKDKDYLRALPNYMVLSTQRGLKSVSALRIGDICEYGEIDSIRIVKEEPEVALCSLAAIVVSAEMTEEQRRSAYYYALLMIDKCIHQSEYVLPHVGVTAKLRLNAGVGITGLAYHMAKKNLKYSSPEGKAEIHRVAEEHAYLAIEQSLRLGKELGNAPWMHKTKWPEGWLPIDTYNKTVDEVTPSVYRYDWESLRAQIIANGGIRNSCVIAHMPTESSSKASGAPNGLYPVRQLAMVKTDNTTKIDWVAPDGDTIGNQYELAWDVPTKDMIDCYAIVQKFTDQGISADLYRVVAGEVTTVPSTVLISDYIHMTKRGLKSRYYQNTKTSEGTDLTSVKKEVVAQPTVALTETRSIYSNPEYTVSDASISADEGSAFDLENGDCSDGVCKM